MEKSRRFPMVLNEDDLKKIIFSIINNPSNQRNIMGEFHKWRDSTVILLQFYAGLRPGEALGLKWSDIDYKKRLIKIDPMNNHEHNDIPAILTKPAIKALNEYSNVLNRMGITCEWLFPSMWTWKPITTDAFGKRLQKIFKLAGISQISFYTKSGMPKYENSSYDFRHSFATRVYNKTRDIRIVSALLRQTRVESAQVYTHISMDDKIKTVDNVFN